MALRNRVSRRKGKRVFKKTYIKNQIRRNKQEMRLINRGGIRL